MTKIMPLAGVSTMAKIVDAMVMGMGDGNSDGEPLKTKKSTGNINWFYRYNIL
jgi:hypothetical protein